MNPDDESIPSAYFDDELGADALGDVESRVGDDPAWAGQLADFAAIRRAVADLPRPQAPCRLASAVLARVAAAESARSRRPYYWVATAASLAFGCLLMLRSGLIDGPRPVADVAVLADPPVAPIEEADVASVPGRAREAPPIQPEVVVSRLGPAPDRDGPARRRMFSLLEGPGLGRIVVVAGFDDESAAGRVDELLRGSARKNPEYSRVAVAPGLAIDPRHPEGGEAFVAVMDDLERREFLGKLGRTFDRVIDEPAADPGLASQLADLEGITLGSGPSAAGLKPPPPDAKVAIQHTEPTTVERSAIYPEVPPAIRPFRGVDPMKGGSVVVQAEEPDEAADAPDPAPRRPARRVGSRPTGPAPVIIWVAGPHGPGPIE